jgi:CheY-like chemotaxis protein
MYVVMVNKKNYLYKRVVIVDDGKMDRIISSTVIKRDLFAEEISDFGSAIDALNYLHSLINTPDKFPPVIFLDVNMPGMDGFDFLDAFRKFPESVQKLCTVIMISATQSVDDLKRIHTYPSVQWFFNKPLTDKMLHKVRDATDRRTPM